MGKLKVELEVFAARGSSYDEDGDLIAGGDLEAAIIAAAAEKVLAVDVPDESEKGYHRTDKVRALLEEKIEAAVDERIKAVTLDEVDKAIRESIAEGWQKTDEWGGSVGKPVSLKQRISDVLNSKPDSYKNETRIQQVARDTIEGALRTIFKEELDKARIAFRAQIDGVLQAKLRETLAESLGLRA